MDYRKLVPRTPPEGLEEWVLRTCSPALDRFGLVYEAAYDDEDLFCSWPMARPEKYKRTKMVRVTCSFCGDSVLLDWAKDAAHGYGFIHPDDQEGDWAHTVTAAGDESTCPCCEARVLVNKRSAVRDSYVTAECQVMSASVLPGGELVLTGWSVQRRTGKNGWDELKILPAEAYVFTEKDCFQLMGWTNGYSGHGGYFIQYCSSWRQPRQWRERWGQTEQIFGLTPELIDRSRLPHCKLDVYMAPRPGARHYPVAWLRLYQDHPNAEAVLLHGLPRVLDGLIAAVAWNSDWTEKNEKGRLELPQIDWTQTRPAQMLGLTKEELRMGRKQDWEKFFWELFTAAKGVGEQLTGEDLENAFILGDNNLLELVARGQVARSIRYLLRQCENRMDAEDTVPDEVPDAQTLRDYWDMSEALGRNLNDPSVKYPADLIEAHERSMYLVKALEQHISAERFRIRRRLLKKYAFASGGLLIRPAASQRELTAEGDALHHCVGTYGQKHASGQTAIFFIRRTRRPGEPYFTLELDEKTLTVRQNRGLRNCDPPEEVRAFVQTWLEWARHGAKHGERRRAA